MWVLKNEANFASKKKNSHTFKFVLRPMCQKKLWSWFSSQKWEAEQHWWPWLARNSDGYILVSTCPICLPFKAVGPSWSVLLLFVLLFVGKVSVHFFRVVCCQVLVLVPFEAWFFDALPFFLVGISIMLSIADHLLHVSSPHPWVWGLCVHLGCGGIQGAH